MSQSPGIYIGIGANIDPEENIIAGLDLLKGFVLIKEISTFYRSEAIGAPGTPDFLNGVCRIETSLSPRALKFGVLRKIEANTGRQRTFDPNAPRTLDLDLILYGDVVDAELGLPDEDVLKRPFLFKALDELDPELRWPGTDQPLRDAVTPDLNAKATPDSAYTDKVKETVCA